MNKDSSKPSRPTGFIAILGLIGMVLAGAIAFGIRHQQNHVPTDIYLGADISPSAKNDKQFTSTAQAICENTKNNSAPGDSLTLVALASSSQVMHSQMLEHGHDVISACSDENFLNLLTATTVSSHPGTSLHSGVERLTQHRASQMSLSDGSGSDMPKRGTVILLYAHSNDQGNGNQAIPLVETTALIEELLNERTAMVIFALDPVLENALAEVLQHPRVRVSPLSKQSMTHSVHWAFEKARTPIDGAESGLPTLSDVFSLGE